MDRFENVTVIKKANVYFDGKVTSRTVSFADGTRKTLGIIQSGEYEFGTAEKEIMEILEGEGKVLIKGADKWIEYGPEHSFEIPSQSSFKIIANSITDYCCSYIKE